MTVDSTLKGNYWLTRIAYLRCLGFLFLVAFTISLLQNEGLIGEKGLTPAVIFMEKYHQHFNKNLNHFVISSPFLQRIRPLLEYFNIEIDHRLAGFLNHPTIFWYFAPTTKNILFVSGAGGALSFIVFLCGACNVVVMATLWLFYFSIVNIGQTWYSFGWESQLLETAFLTCFTCPLLSLSRFPKYTPMSWSVRWGLIWLLFRIMIGAGMIKIRGDQCWRDLTCMHYHYQTQPVPNPASIYYHNSSDLFHKFETFMNHMVELVFPILLLVPHRTTQMVGGAIQIGFQFILISSGNLSFLNWLTGLPGLACFDDQFYARFFSGEEVQNATKAAIFYEATIASFSEGPLYKHKKNDDVEQSSDTAIKQKKSWIAMHFSYRYSWSSTVVLCRRLISLFIFIWVGILSYPVIENILSPHQGMNISFDPFRVVNSYGAFGSVTKVRHEVILQGTSDNALSPNTKWKEFQFTCKPGDIDRRPCVISPYHFRMDWLMWFAAFQSYQQCPWIVHLADKLLNGEKEPNLLLAPNGNPFYNISSPDEEAKRDAPKFIRAVLYKYEYPALSLEDRTKEASEGWEIGKWWKRRYVQEYMPAIDANNPSVIQFLVGNGLIKK